MDEAVAMRMNLASDWEMTAEGRADAVSRALEVLASSPHDRDATDLLYAAGMYVLPFSRQREIAQQLLTAESSSVAGAVLASRAAYQLGGLDEAVAGLRDNLAAHPEHVSGWLRLATHQMGLTTAGHLAAAQEALDRACALASDDPDCCIVRARMLIQRKHRVEGIALLRQLRPRAPIDVELELARALFLTRQPKEADSLLDGVLSLVPDYPLALLLRVLMRASQNRGQEALEAAQALLTSAGPGSDAYMTYGLVCLKVGAPEAAAASFEYQTQLRPDSTYAWTCLALARRRMHDGKGARRARAEALETMPAKGLKARIGLALSLLRLRLQTAPTAPTSLANRVTATIAMLLCLGLLTGIVAGLGWLAEGRWVIGALGVSPLIIFAWVLLYAFRSAPTHLRRHRTGGALLVGSIAMTLVHAVLAGIGVASPEGLLNAVVFLYFWLGTAGVVLLFLARQKPRTDAEGNPIPSKSMRDIIRAAQPDPTVRAALGAISLIIGVPGVLCGGMFLSLTVVGIAVNANTSGLGPVAEDIGVPLGLSLMILAGFVAHLALLVGGTGALVDRHDAMSYRKKLVMVWCYVIAAAVFLAFGIAAVFASGT